MKKTVPFLFLLLLAGCLTWSRQWDLGTYREASPGVYSCVLKIPRSSEVVNVGADIFHHSEKYIPVQCLKIRIENEESHEIQIQGIPTFVFLKPGESYEFTVKAGPATKDVDGAYICAFNAPVGVKLDISGEHLDDTTIKITGDAGYGP
jgi:hypothetical protein